MPRSLVSVVVGSRPEAIKMAPVVFALRSDGRSFDVVVVSTGQQREMIPQALAEFGLKADIDLDVMEPNQSLAGLTSRLVTRLESVWSQLKPDCVLVQGDTTSAMVGALTSFYRRIPVGHVEAGMRTENPFSPFPEEVNRRMISQCATWHFAPTTRSGTRLLEEGIPASRVFITGNTVVDALLWMRRRLQQQASTLSESMRARLLGRRVVFVTTHRRENFGEGVENICNALKALCHLVDDVAVVIPVHPNPNVKQTVERLLASEPHCVLIEPQPYHVLVELLDRADLVLTDSGGLQEEAPTFGVPVLVMRDTTERPEGIEAGVARLVGTNRDAIVESALELLTDSGAHDRMARACNPYGDGSAADRIVDALDEQLRPGERDTDVEPPAVGEWQLSS